MRIEITEIPLPQRNAEHTVKIALQTHSGIQAAWMQVFVPRFSDDTPFVRISSDEYQICLDDSALWNKFDCEGTTDGQRKLRVVVENFVWRSRQSRAVAEGRFEIDLWVIPLDITILMELGTPQEVPDKECFVSLTQNKRAKPRTTFVHNRDGLRTIEHKDAKTLTLGDGCAIRLDEHFDWSFENGATCCPRLVGEVIGAMNVLEHFPINQTLEDAVLLLSFFTATRTLVTRVSVLENGALTERHITRLGRLVYPSRFPFDEGLVQDYDIEHRFREAWIAWNTLDKRESLRQAIYAFVPGSKHVVALEYLRLFSAIEGLVNAFPGTESDISSPVSLNRHHAALSQLGRELRLRGIEADELGALDAAVKFFGRPSFKEQFNKFCQCWSVDTDDLWPMSAPQSTGLYELRNRVAHGSGLSLDVEKAISIASSHLVYLLARCLLRVLRSPVDGTFVHYPQGVPEETMLAGLKPAMDTIRRNT
jgi:hypothetical protein